MRVREAEHAVLEHAVLIVEDDEATAELERRTLSRSGIRVRAVSRVTDAVDLLRREAFSAVLLDYQLPDDDPWLVLQEAQARAPRIPVIIVTAMGNERVAAEAIHRGAAEYVKKTDSFWDQLPAMVQRVARLAQIEEDLRRSDALFRLISENTSDWIALTDLNGAYKYVSPASRHMFGQEPEELIGRRALEFVHSDDCSEIGRILASASTTHEPFRLTYRHRHKDGSFRWVEAQITTLRDPTGVPREMLETVRDITDRVKADESRRKEQEQLAEAQRLAHLGSWEWDVTTDELEWSDELYRICGLSHHESVASYDHFLQCVHSLDRNRVHDVVQRALEDGRPFSIEFRVRRPDGEIRFVHSLGQVSVDKSRQLRRMTGTAQDITDRKELEARVAARTEQIHASLREKEVLLKEIHHRVKNNLQVISSLLNLQAAHLDNPSARRMFAQSRDRVYAIALVHEKLYQSSDLSHVNFDEYVRSLVQSLFQSLDAANRGVAAKVEVSPVRLSVDKAIPCALIINELVTNSLKHAFPKPRTGSVNIRMRPCGCEQLELAIEDDGVGFPTGVDPRAIRSLGLDLVFTFADQLEARVDVQREPTTAFTFRFSSRSE